MKEKIKHPFQTPNNFFEDFKNDMENTLYELPHEKHQFLRKFTLQFTKYAAIVVIAFLVGRYSIILTNNNDESTHMETIFNQVSEDEIIDFVIEDELFKEL